jgi:hypothetical protein
MSIASSCSRFHVWLPNFQLINSLHSIGVISTRAVHLIVARAYSALLSFVSTLRFWRSRYQGQSSQDLSVSPALNPSHLLWHVQHQVLLIRFYEILTAQRASLLPASVCASKKWGTMVRQVPWECYTTVEYTNIIKCSTVLASIVDLSVDYGTM